MDLSSNSNFSPFQPNGQISQSLILFQFSYLQNGTKKYLFVC